MEIGEETTCSRCGEPGTWEACPYDMDVNNATEEEALCDCCGDCSHECAMDI